MTKKKVESADSSTDSSEEESQTTKKGCIHVNKGVVLATLRKQLQGANFKGASSASSNLAKSSPSAPPNALLNAGLSCKECKTSSQKSPEAEDEELWVCLRCGSVACGSPEKNDSHISKHFTDPRSDPHVIAVNIDQWKAWCHKCSKEIDMNCTKKLQEAAEFLKKHSANVSQAAAAQDKAPTPETKDSDENELPQKNDNSEPVVAKTSYQKIKGLTNLGNTCFFNSVLQCLAQTPSLLNLLSGSIEGEEFSLPGFAIDEDHPELPTIQGTLEPPGAVTKELARTIKELQTNDYSCVVNPKSLLNALSQRAPHLAGTGDQEDAHELLRTLMESVRSEELRRYQGRILDAIGVSRKIDPSSVDEEKKYMAKMYSSLATKLYLRPDHLFQGQLVSILQCQECQTTSCTSETFLDISLPVVCGRQAPPTNRKSVSESNPDAPSKHQLKKARQASRKGRKAKQAQITADNQNEDVVDADVEDNESQGKSVETDSVDYNRENGEDSDEAANGEEKEDSEMEKIGSEGKLVNGNDENDAGSEDQKVVEGLERLTIPDKTELVEDAIEIAEDAIEKVEEGEAACEARVTPNADGDAAEVDDNSRWSTTLAPRTTICDPPGETSLITCLSQFSAIELLTGNNKVGCETCTKRAGKTSNGKTVCTNFTKQLLISAPPGVLTLHLKRFEVCGSRFRKVSKSVNFPLILDLASVCSVKCENMPTVKKNQSKLLYALYGLVEHHGMLSGGHYVAYIKSQKPPTANDFRRRFFLSNTHEHVENESADDVECEENPEAPPGKWYYASDSFVSEVPEKKILEKQAYMLFYERIY